MYKKNVFSVHDLLSLHVGIRTENSRHVGVQEDSSFYGDLGEWREVLKMLPVADHHKSCGGLETSHNFSQ